MLRLLDEQEPRNRTSKLELPIPSVLVRLPAPCVGSRKTFPLYKTSGLVNQLVVASWKHPGRSAPTEDICKPPIYSRVACWSENSVVARIRQKMGAPNMKYMITKWTKTAA